MDVLLSEVMSLRKELQEIKNGLSSTTHQIVLTEKVVHVEKCTQTDKVEIVEQLPNDVVASISLIVPTSVMHPATCADSSENSAMTDTKIDCPIISRRIKVLKKKIKTTDRYFTIEAKAILEKYFARSRYYNRAGLECISLKCNLTIKQV